MEPSIDRDAIREGDTLRWRHRVNATTCWGLVEYAHDAGVRVRTGSWKKPMGRYTVPWERITGHWPGRAEFDKRRLIR